MLDVIVLMSMIIHISGNPAVNLALLKPACMSSTLSSNYAWLAVDGKNKTNKPNLCSMTAENDMTPWLMIDLHGTYLVNNVVLTNRGDNFEWRLHSFVIEIFEKNPKRCAGAISEVCFNYTGVALGKGETRTFTCDTSVRGRFVRIMKWKMNATDDLLTLCEVQIFGSTSTGCGYPHNIQRIIGTRLASVNVELTTDMTPMECAVRCERKSNCLAFNFNGNTTECELLFNPMFEDHKETIPAWSYYGSDLC